MQDAYFRASVADFEARNVDFIADHAIAARKACCLLGGREGVVGEERRDRVRTRARAARARAARACLRAPARSCACLRVRVLLRVRHLLRVRCLDARARGGACAPCFARAASALRVRAAVGGTCSWGGRGSLNPLLS
jgi:hypothetical protein